ncbi:MAG: molybdate ABC transporter substrate-binding protein [Rhodobacterales bacterium]|nr:MAG: molybdate ABC transporter substrate-binding protein [Rhodobacterales bacterium]
MFLRSLLVALLLFALPAAAGPARVFAAASLQDVLEDASVDLVPVLAGSSVLARQILSGAPADLFISADPHWVRQVGGEPVIVARNRLVLVGKEGAAPVDLEGLGAVSGRVAIGLSDAVPVGVYARAALEKAGLWQALRPRLVEAEHARAVLKLVTIGAVDYGIVYATDALATDRLGFIAPITHSPVSYAAVALSEPGEVVLDYFLSPAGQAIFARHGFLPVSDD